jgi:hypothetical protein
MELAGLEPATSWVRYRPNRVASGKFGSVEPCAMRSDHPRFAQFGSTDGRSRSSRAGAPSTVVHALVLGRACPVVWRRPSAFPATARGRTPWSRDEFRGIEPSECFWKKPFGRRRSRHRHFRRHKAPRSMPQTGWYTWHPIRAEKKSRLAVVANAAAGTSSRWSSSASRAAAR